MSLFKVEYKGEDAFFACTIDGYMLEDSKEDGKRLISWVVLDKNLDVVLSGDMTNIASEVAPFVEKAYFTFRNFAKEDERGKKFMEERFSNSHRRA